MADLKTFLVVNPQSANGRTGSRFPEISAALKAGLDDFEYAFTTRQGHATELARGAIQRGFQRIVAVGGDGTVNEVVNGFFDGRKVIDPEAIFALIPRGTGGDFRKTFGWSNELPEAVERLRSPKLSRVDVGRMELTNPQGQTQNPPLHQRGLLRHLGRGQSRGEPHLQGAGGAAVVQVGQPQGAPQVLGSARLGLLR